MTSVETFKSMFKGVSLEAEDLFLLEAFQISYLPGWVSEREFAAVLWAYPALKRYLIKRHPPIAGFIERVMAESGPARDDQKLAKYSEGLVWTIADLLVYNKCPEAYDEQGFHRWDFGEVTGITPLMGKTVIDGGAGTGRVTLEAARAAARVYAVEPVARLRQFIREKAAQAGLGNVYVVDGFLDDIPFSAGFADLLVTSHALGWRLEKELAEFERVVKRGGTIIHCPGTAESPTEEERHRRLISSDWGYQWARYQAPDGWKRKYWKRVT